MPKSAITWSYTWGVALNTVDEAEANQVFDYLREMGDLAELEETEKAQQQDEVTLTNTAMPRQPRNMPRRLRA